MKPKLNILKDNITCDEIIFEDFPSLKCSVISYDSPVFDATLYCEEEKITMPEYHIFYSQCIKYIEAKIKDEGLSNSNLFYLSSNNHLLIHTSLIIIFLQYVNPNVISYFNGLLISCLINGVGFSDGFAMRLAATQLSDETLNEIIDSRKNEKSE